MSRTSPPALWPLVCAAFTVVGNARRCVLPHPANLASTDEFVSRSGSLEIDCTVDEFDRWIQDEQLPGTAISVTRYLTIALVIASLCLAAPYAGVVIASIWAAQLARPIMPRVAGRRRVAAAVTVLIVLIAMTPLAIVALVAAATARELIHTHSTTALALLDSARGGAMAGVRLASSGASHILIGFALFVVGAYTCLVDGNRMWAWAKRTVPLPPHTLDRLGAAFEDCGRSLFVGVVLTALTQGVIATIVYAAVRVPHPFAMGALTFLAAFVPLVGTASVWLPLSVSLAATGRPVAAVVLAGLGIVVIGTIDNVVRPIFSRSTKLALPIWVLALSMFGGLALLGFQGMLIGPLIVRLTAEMLELSRV